MDPSTASHRSNEENDRMTPLHSAIQNIPKEDGDTKIVMMVMFAILKANQTSLQETDVKGNTCLHYLVQNRPPKADELVKVLFNEGVVDTKKQRKQDSL